MTSYFDCDGVITCFLRRLLREKSVGGPYCTSPTRGAFGQGTVESIILGIYRAIRPRSKRTALPHFPTCLQLLRGTMTQHMDTDIGPHTRVGEDDIRRS